MRAALPWLLVFAACGDNVRAPAEPRWHVRDGFLRAPDGRAAILRGVNLSGAHKYAPYLDDKQPADYARVRDAWGMNAVRFLMTWAAVEPEPGRYDDAYLDAVAERLGWAHAAGLAVVLDMHQDIFGEGFGFDGAPRWACDEARYAAFVPKEPWYLSATDPNVMACVDELYMLPERRNRFIAAWRHVAERLAGAPAVVGFDPLNEPNWGTYPLFQFETDILAPFYGDIVATVREVAPAWVAFAEPSASRNVGFLTQLRELPFDNVVYAPHSYDQAAESGAGFDPAQRQKLLDYARDVAGEAQVLGAALWIGEYGGMVDAPNIGPYMTAQYDAAGSVAAGAMYWAYDKGGGYSILDADGHEKPALMDVIVRPFPTLVAGDPIAYAFDAAASRFTFTYTPDAAVASPTEISVPARVYPDGYTVDCGGCEHAIAGETVVVTRPPAARPATVTLAPR
ncbi:MAG: cellulase family glycosylhydrolase [Deltaproteobacteria bacterium]|nr:cellulase family glycosylhydrolase [Deltaproteobacteria bacterium]